MSQQALSCISLKRLWVGPLFPQVYLAIPYCTSQEIVTGIHIRMPLKQYTMNHFFCIFFVLKRGKRGVALLS